MSKRKPERSGLKQTLDSLYESFDFAGRVKNDPISFPKKYPNNQDIELAGFIAASFAYGKVSLFMPVIERLLSRMGESPHLYIESFDPRTARRLLGDISYRFHKPPDIEAFLYVLSRVLREFGSLESLFMKHYKSDDPDVGPALDGMIRHMLSYDLSAIYGNAEYGQGFTHFLPLPSGGSACKRMNLFLRWMIRKKDIDFGIWDRVKPSKLIIPLDTHIARIGRCLGLTKRASSDWKTAVAITDSLRLLDPEDPLKYDFALCHRGIAGLCVSDKSLCPGCGLKRFRRAADA